MAHPDARGRGLGRLVVTALVGNAREAGIEIMAGLVPAAGPGRVSPVADHASDGGSPNAGKCSAPTNDVTSAIRFPRSIRTLIDHAWWRSSPSRRR